MSELTAVPSFMFDQENEDRVIERSIHVLYYNGSVALIQGNQKILIDEYSLKRFCKELVKNYELAKSRKPKPIP